MNKLRLFELYIDPNKIHWNADYGKLKKTKIFNEQYFHKHLRSSSLLFLAKHIVYLSANTKIGNIYYESIRAEKNGAIFNSMNWQWASQYQYGDWPNQNWAR